jgi:hypothetical protein
MLVSNCLKGILEHSDNLATTQFPWFGYQSNYPVNTVGSGLFRLRLGGLGIDSDSEGLHMGRALPEFGIIILLWVPANGARAESISTYLSRLTLSEAGPYEVFIRQVNNN